MCLYTVILCSIKYDDSFLCWHTLVYKCKTKIWFEELINNIIAFYCIHYRQKTKKPKQYDQYIMATLSLFSWNLLKCCYSAKTHWYLVSQNKNWMQYLYNKLFWAMVIWIRLWILDVTKCHSMTCMASTRELNLCDKAMW